MKKRGADSQPQGEGAPSVSVPIWICVQLLFSKRQALKMFADWCRNWWTRPPGMDLGVALQHQGNMPYSGRQMLPGAGAAQQLQLQLQLQQLLHVACLQQGELVSGCTILQMRWRRMLPRIEPGLKHPLYPCRVPGCQP